MPKYAIAEEGSSKFATIEAASAEEALDAADEQYSRRAADYNGYTGTVRWYAREIDGPDSCSRLFRVDE